MENFETWNPVLGYEPFYEVSDRGSVRSVRSGKTRKTHVTPDGYERLGLYGKAGRKYFYVHTLVLEAFVEPRPFKSAVARHLNGDSRDNNVSNLAWGTQKENVADSIRHGTNNQLRKTECPWGHPLSGVNLRLDRVGNRHCRCCGQARGRLNNPQASHLALANELLVRYLEEERKLKQLDKELGEV